MSTSPIHGRYLPPGIEDSRTDKPEAIGVRQHKHMGRILSFIGLAFKDEKGNWLNKGSAIGFINRKRHSEGRKDFLQGNISLSKVKRIFNATVYPKGEGSVDTSRGKETGKASKIKSVSLEAELTDEEIAYLKNNTHDGNRNTGLTQILAHYAFVDPKPYKDDKGKINAFIQRLVEKASTNLDARLALITPNAEGKNFNETQLNAGNPQNTPLHLFVKMGNLESGRAILPFYDKEHLMAITPGKNTALHLCLATGQVVLALEIMRRAQELGCLDELLKSKNKGGFSPGEIYEKYRTAVNRSPPNSGEISLGEGLLQFANRFFGKHEELDKAIVVKDRYISSTRTKKNQRLLFDSIAKKKNIRLKATLDLNLNDLFVAFLKPQ